MVVNIICKTAGITGFGLDDCHVAREIKRYETVTGLIENSIFGRTVATLFLKDSMVRQYIEIITVSICNLGDLHLLEVT